MTTPTILFAIFALDPGLEPPRLAKSAGRPIQIEGGHLAPVMADLDGDGADDLIVGDFEPGGIRFFRNLGRRGSPEFEGHVVLRARGKEIRVDAG
jgi:hypothetical protein